MTHEDDLRQQMATLCASQFQRGFRVGTAGNVSAPSIPRGSPNATWRGGISQATGSPRRRFSIAPHLWRRGASALDLGHGISCLEDLDPDDCIPPLTPYVVMRVGTVGLLPYVNPRDPKGGDLIAALGGAHAAVLLANHGPVVSGKDLLSAVCAAEELEATATLMIATRDQKTRLLSQEEIADLRRSFAEAELYGGGAAGPSAERRPPRQAVR